MYHYKIFEAQKTTIEKCAELVIGTILVFDATENRMGLFVLLRKLASYVDTKLERMDMGVSRAFGAKGRGRNIKLTVRPNESLISKFY